ncbi:c-type cytochrome [Pararhodobacter sp.]|uniref:c-type cytochrome n=1 Tax=Pararhodobacter sp. TaxID=2127056 RepID=UPI002AFF8C2D|nr:c-type cytochrome [Pararhodobacter sp.]
MFDTMVITKTVAALCAALLFFLLANWGASAIYLPAAHGDDHAHAVYPLPVEGGEGAAPAAPTNPDDGIDVMALYETADSAAGAALWRNCQSCHKLDGTNGTGPHLDGVVDRAIDAVDGYNYSGALLAMGETWSVENLFHFLRDPRGMAPGTRMSFRGLSSPEDRVNLIRYLADHPG